VPRPRSPSSVPKQEVRPNTGGGTSWRRRLGTPLYRTAAATSAGNSGYGDDPENRLPRASTAGQKFRQAGRRQDSPAKVSACPARPIPPGFRSLPPRIRSRAKGKPVGGRASGTGEAQSGRAVAAPPRESPRSRKAPGPVTRASSRPPAGDEERSVRLADRLGKLRVPTGRRARETAWQCKPGKPSSARRFPHTPPSPRGVGPPTTSGFRAGQTSTESPNGNQRTLHRSRRPPSETRPPYRTPRREALEQDERKVEGATSRRPRRCRPSRQPEAE